MQTPELHHINTTVSIVSLRNFIRELSVTKEDTIFLHQRDLDAIALQYRNKYDLPFPHSLNEVSIREDLSNKVRVGTIGTIRDFVPEISSTENDIDERAYETIYRCGFCGNIVSENGREFDPQTRRNKIAIFEKFNNPVQHVNGGCCPDGNQ